MKTGVTGRFTGLLRSAREKASRDSMVFILALVLLYALIVPAYIYEKKAEKELDSLRSRMNEFSELIREYNKLKVELSAIEGKSSLSKTGGIMQVIDEVLISMNIKDKMKSIRGIESRNIREQIKEESAEVQIEKLTMNELLHIFYKIENAPMILSIKKLSVKKSFATPERLDVNMTVSLFTLPAAGIK
jgi:type II secretory pathway component PulM